MTRDDRGATSVELAIVLPVFLVVVGSVLTMGLAMAYAGLADHGARVGLRAATVRTSTGYPDAARVRQTIDASLAGLLPTPANDDASLLVRGPSTSPTGAQGDRVVVTVRYTVPAVRAALDLVPDAGLRARLQGLATVQRSAAGRLE